MGFRFGVGTAAVAAHHSHLRLFLFGSASQQGGDFFCHFGTAGGTAQAVHVTLFHKGFCHGSATGFAAAAAVGAGQHLCHLVNKGVFNNLKLLCYKVQHHREDGSCNAQD